MSGVPALTVREAARQRRALDGVDAQALEGALSLTEAERDAYKRAAAEAVATWREVAGDECCSTQWALAAEMLEGMIKHEQAKAPQEAKSCAAVSDSSKSGDRRLIARLRCSIESLEVRLDEAKCEVESLSLLLVERTEALHQAEARPLPSGWIEVACTNCDTIVGARRTKSHLGLGTCDACVAKQEGESCAVEMHVIGGAPPSVVVDAVRKAYADIAAQEDESCAVEGAPDA